MAAAGGGRRPAAHAHEKVPRGRFLPSKSVTLNLLEYEFQIFAILRLIMNLLILEKCN